MSNTGKTYIKRNPRGPRGTYVMRQVRPSQQSPEVTAYVITVPKSIGDAFRDKGLVWVWSAINNPSSPYHGNIMLTPVVPDDTHKKSEVDSDAAAIAAMFGGEHVRGQVTGSGDSEGEPLTPHADDPSSHG
jgi:hypothetical protein